MRLKWYNMLNLLEAFRSEQGRTKKSFGQHFLTNPGILDSIVKASGAADGVPVIEIGPGCGVLTVRLLDTGTELTAVEIDRDLAEFLTRYLHIMKNFRLVNSDVLKVDLGSLYPEKKVSIVGNLPYNVSVKIFEHCTAYLPAIDRMVFMFQKEVADRIAAEPGTKAYSSLSVFASYHFTMKKVRDIGGGNFWPNANVMSSVVTFTPVKERPFSGQREEAFLRMVRECFTLKRKTLRNNLTKYPNIESIIQSAGYKPTIRGEEMSLADFVRFFEHAESCGISF